ncbi:FUSC family protein [Pseudomonas syringae pv. syringae]|uniref:FUSC family protein n=1 Tax=Pseudomonas syringae TaxID=317 RepID=UPI0023F8297B|nr:FUSC family protein [Pseudomonas syringae]MDF5890219.1 FUSC family protein [Pseudomonas syringae pv. syringae]
MAPTALDSYLLGNKVAVKTGIKISISVLGALFIALLMNFEHPVWAMITGMISFFAPDHAQVLKKCLFQCFSTVVGGIVGVALMNFLGQSPLMAALSVATIVFIASALSYHTRDANRTFLCAIFAVTVCIMVMVTVTLVPTSEEIYEIFVDRIGTIIVGIVWASFVSACIWPMFSSDLLRLSSGRLFKSVFALNTQFGSDPEQFRVRLSSVFSGIIEHADLADHCEFEGAWGRRGAQVAREMNKLAIEVTTDSYALQQIEPVYRQRLAVELNELERLVDVLAHQAIPGGGDVCRLQSFMADTRERSEQVAHEDGELSMFLGKIADLAQHLSGFAQLYASLMRAEKISVKGVSVRRHRQLSNCLITGARSAVLFLLGFMFWYATDWTYGFLMCVVPIVFSIMLGKLPHPELILKNIAIGFFVAIPVGMVVMSVLAQAPSAVELLLLTSGVVLFFGFMGLSSLSSFAYSLGFNISFMVFLLPENVPSVDIGFAIERSLSMGLGTILLALLYIWIPRKRVLKDPARVSDLFVHDLEDFLTDSTVERSSSSTLAERVGLVIDKMVYVSIYECPEKKSELIEQAGRAIFLMSQVRHVSALFETSHRSSFGNRALPEWRAELLVNYRSGTIHNEHPLITTTSPTNAADDQHPRLSEGYLAAMDRLTRRAFILHD